MTYTHRGMRMRRRTFLTLPAVAALQTRAMAMSDAFEVTSRWLVLIDPFALDLALRAL